MTVEKKSLPEKTRLPIFAVKRIFLLLFFLYAAGAIPAAWTIITETQASTQAIEKILNLYNMKNEGAQALARWDKKHPILGALVSSPIQHTMKLPSQEESTEALHEDLPHALRSVRQTSSLAAWSSWFLLSLSFCYVVASIIFDRALTTRPVIFSLTTINAVFFVIGIIAPAMVIWTAPDIPMETGNLNFVAQHQVRGIAAIIRELLTDGHWIIGGFLLLFSIITPIAKISLTYLATASSSRELNARIGAVLHTIGKWSMADVFVAAIILSLYALKFQQATKSIPCLGLYYFIGYCLLSMTTTQIMVHSEVMTPGAERQSRRKLGLMVIAGLIAALFCFVSASSLYTYEQYTANVDQKVATPTAPQQLNSSHLVLPAHK